MTIVNLAQNFVGSNNINLLKPEGQFGTRSQVRTGTAVFSKILTRYMRFREVKTLRLHVTFSPIFLE